MLPLVIRAATSVVGRVGAKVWTAATSAKDAVELYQTAREWFSEASPIKKAATVAMTASVLAAPFAAPAVMDRMGSTNSSSGQSSYLYVQPGQLAITEDDGRVFHASFLIQNPHVLNRILQLCAGGQETNMTRCDQANDAVTRIYAQQLNERNRKSITAKW